MGIWDEYCLVCGGPLKNDLIKGEILYDTSDNEYIVPKTMAEYNWLNKLYLISRSGVKIPAEASQYESSGYFVVNGLIFTVTPLNWHQNPYLKNGKGFDYGIVCHRACYNLLSQELHYGLIFGDVCRLLNENNCLLNPVSKYGKMAEYIGQIFDIFKADVENNWLLSNPISNTENSERILKIWTPLVKVFKKTAPRPSPCESATKFNSGTVIKGNDNQLWIVVRRNNINRWERYVEDDNISKLQENKLKTRSRSRKGSRKGSRSVNY